MCVCVCGHDITASSLPIAKAAPRLCQNVPRAAAAIVAPAALITFFLFFGCISWEEKKKKRRNKEKVETRAPKYEERPEGEQLL